MKSISELFKTTRIEGFMFELGSRVRDKITGYEGIIICRAQWLNNCNTYSVKRTELKDGLPQDSVSFDEPQLELVEEDVVSSSRNTGGPERAMPSTR